MSQQFIASELFAYFVHPNPQEGLVEGLGAGFRQGKLELRPLLRTIFTSRAFYSPGAIGVQIKSPVQLVVGTTRLLGIAPPPLRAVYQPLQLMGQVPMMPPNVKGWPGGHSWINASTMFARYNTAVRLASGRLSLGDLPDASTDAGAFVDALVGRLIQRPIAASQRKILLDACAADPGNENTLHHIAQLIVSTPEYQLC